MPDAALSTELEALREVYGQRQKATNNLLTALKSTTSTLGKLSYELAQALLARLGLPPDSTPCVAAPQREGWWWFHCLGDLYGRAALDLLRYRVAAAETEALGLAIRLPEPPEAPPARAEAQVVRYLHDRYREYEQLLELGPFQHLLPPLLRRRAVVAQFDVPHFLAATAGLHLTLAPEALGAQLSQLLAH
jgi:hypothetical protein